MEYRGSNGQPIPQESAKPTGLSLYEIYFPHIAQKVSNKAGNAKNNQREFEVKNILQILDVMNKSGGRCYYTGKLFNDLNDITFERIDPNKGYTMENTVFVKTEVNSCKAQLDAFEKNDIIPDEMKVKLLNKLIYRLNKQIKEKANAES